MADNTTPAPDGRKRDVCFTEKLLSRQFVTVTGTGKVITFFFSETLKIHFTFQTLTEIRQLYLVLVSGEYEVNCDESRNKCNVSLQERSMKNVSILPIISILP